MFEEHAVDFGSVADACLFEGISAAFAHFRKTIKITGIREFVEVNHRITRVLDDVSDHCGAR